MKLLFFSKKKKKVLLKYFADIVKYKSFFILNKLKGIGDISINKLNYYFTFDNTSQLPHPKINIEDDYQVYCGSK
jgi:hypothetical protein